jgi:hypothetical protein
LGEGLLDQEFKPVGREFGEGKAGEDRFAALLRKMAQVEEKKLNALHSKVLADDEAYITLLCDKEDSHIKDALMSNQKFANLLEEFGVDPPMKISQTTGKETYAFAKTDKGLQDLREHPDSTVQALVEARLGNKTTIEETRTERMIGIATRGVFPVPLKYSGAIRCPCGGEGHRPLRRGTT